MTGRRMEMTGREESVETSGLKWSFLAEHPLYMIKVGDCFE